LGIPQKLRGPREKAIDFAAFREIRREMQHKYFRIVNSF